MLAYSVKLYFCKPVKFKILPFQIQAFQPGIPLLPGKYLKDLNLGPKGQIYRDLSAILKFNLSPVFLSKILRSISSKNSAYQVRTQMLYIVLLFSACFISGPVSFAINTGFYRA
jgi:hypothetical protein